MQPLLFLVLHPPVRGSARRPRLAASCVPMHGLHSGRLQYRGRGYNRKSDRLKLWPSGWMPGWGRIGLCRRKARFKILPRTLAHPARRSIANSRSGAARGSKRNVSIPWRPMDNPRTPQASYQILSRELSEFQAESGHLALGHEKQPPVVHLQLVGDAAHFQDFVMAPKPGV